MPRLLLLLCLLAAIHAGATETPTFTASPTHSPTPTPSERPTCAVGGSLELQWSGMTPPATDRHGLGTASLNGLLYAAGGYNGGVRAELEAYDPATGTWTNLSPMPTARQQVSLVALDGKLYALGGAITLQQTTNEVYDPATDTWSTKAPMPYTSAGQSGVAWGGKIYVSAYRRTILMAYDPGADAWTEIAVGGVAVDRQMTAARDGKVYILGGRIGASLAISSVRIYDIASGANFAGLPLPVAMASGAATVFDGKIFVTGAGSASVYSLDGGGGAWLVHPALPLPLTAPGLAALDGRLMAVGGSDGADYPAPQAAAWVCRADTFTPSPTFTSTVTRTVSPTVTPWPVCGAGQAHDLAWSSAPGPAVALSNRAAASFDGRIVVAGGYAGTRSYAVDALDVGSGAWSSLPAMIYPREQLALVSMGSRLYALGGRTNATTYLRRLISIDPRVDGGWASHPDMPEPSYGTHAATGWNGYVYAAGRNTGRLMAFNASSGAAVYLPGTSPRSRELQGLAALDGTLYIIGGSSSGAPVDWVEAYDLASGTFTDKAPMLRARSNPAVAVWAGRIWAMGGNDGAPSAAVESYDPLTDQWTRHPSLAFAEEGGAVAEMDGRFWIAGGHGGDPLIPQASIQTSSLQCFAHTPTPTPTASATATPPDTPTATATVTLTPAFARQSLGLPVLVGPVPQRSGRPLCLYFEQAPEGARVEAFNLALERVGQADFGAEPAPCLGTREWAPGIYFLRLQQAGQVRWQKVAIIP